MSNLNKYIPKLNALTYDLDGKEYHAVGNTFSSSQMKTMLEDPELFYKKYITKEIEKETGAHFDVGTYFHTAVLEPHKLEEESAIFTGAIRRGKEWDAFSATHKDKLVLTAKEKETAETLVKSLKTSPICLSYLTGGKAEVSAFLEMYVIKSEIFSFKGEDVWCLTSCGWVKTSGDYEPEEIKAKGVRLVVKSRADYINPDRGYISDLKSTTGNTKSEYFMRTKVDSFQYDLSAAMYLDIFNFCCDKPIEDFLWLFASKDMFNARAYKASDKNILVGRNKWRKAILDLAYYIKNNWVFADVLGEIGPSYHNLEWLEDDKCQAIADVPTDDELL